MTDAEQTDLDNCARELATVEATMNAAGQEAFKLLLAEKRGVPELSKKGNGGGS